MFPGAGWGRDLEVRGGGGCGIPVAMRGRGRGIAVAGRGRRGIPVVLAGQLCRGNTTTPAPWFSRPPSSLLILLQEKLLESV